MSEHVEHELIAYELAQTFNREVQAKASTHELQYWLVARASEVAKELLDPTPWTLEEDMKRTERHVRESALPFTSEEVIQQQIQEVNDMLREQWAESEGNPYVEPDRTPEEKAKNNLYQAFMLYIHREGITPDEVLGKATKLQTFLKSIDK